MDDKESEEMMREIGEQIMFQLSYAKKPRIVRINEQF
jgi:hypothetical protein